MWETLVEIVEFDLLPGSEADINVVVLFDHPYTPTDPKGHAYIYELKSASAGGYTIVADWGETNMGDGQVLDDFVSYCKANYPADNYVLSLADHGRAYAGYCYDYHAPHPHWEYAIGDCLTLNEIETALSGPNNVSVILLNVCLGGNFETAWQLVGEADYMLGGISTLGKSSLQTPRNYCYNLSRNPNMTPGEFAKMSFDVSITTGVLPEYNDFWGTCSLYNLSKFPVPVAGPSFMEAFDNFVESLHAELDYNSSQTDTFKWIRNGMGTVGMAPGTAMIVDIKDCLEKIHGNQSLFHDASIGTTASLLLAMLNTGPNEVLINNYNFWDEEADHPAPYMQSFSICFPDSSDMFKGFLYGTMYTGLQLNIDTRWWEFLDRLYPQMVNISRYKLKDFYEIQLFDLDPSIKLDVYFEDALSEVYHVGQSKDFQDRFFGIEVGIEGAEYHDDFYGNFMIRIPKVAVEMGAGRKANGAGTFQVVVDASYAASATQDVNLIVKHITDDEEVWSETQTYDIQLGQKLTTDISTDDEMTDFEVTEASTKVFGEEKIGNSIVVPAVSILMIIIVIHRRKKK
jgi:hypothetical protein